MKGRPEFRLPHLGTLLLVIMPLFNLNAQVTGLISAPNGKPISGCDVFINRTSIQSMTDEFGQFQLRQIPTGFSELVIYKKGYQLYRAPMRIQEDRTYTLNLKLVEEGKKLKGKSTPETVQAFKKELLGDESLVSIENEKQLNAVSDQGQFAILSTDPVIANYPELGYRIHCYFSATAVQSVVDGAFRYEEYLLANVNQNLMFEKKRMAHFRGSLRHFLMALVVTKTKEEGFAIRDQQNNVVESQSLVTAATNTAGYFKIRMEEPLSISYSDGNQVLLSRLSTTGNLEVNKRGIMINPKLLIVAGSMARPGLSGVLPADYLPISGDVESTFEEALNHFYEKVYMHTDKPYYYPGEPLWFKAYLNYYQPEWRDSLSDVLHVDLLGPGGNVMLQRMYRIENGMSNGDIILGDTLHEGIYYLRGYTNLQRNFGETHLFTKPLRILSMVDKMDPTQQQPLAPDRSVQITADKPRYKTREKITLGFHIKDSLGSPLAASLSVAVTDAAQVIAIPETASILNGYLIHRSEIGKIDELQNRIERGVSFYGQFFNNKGKGEKTQLTFIQWKTGDILNATTDEMGKFWQTGLQFTDSAKFSYKSDKAKGSPYGKVILPPRSVPPLNRIDIPDARVVKAGTIQRIFSEYEVPKDNTLLEAVEIKAQRMDETMEKAKRRPFGNADHVLTAKSLNMAYPNLLLSLVGKVPGLTVNPTMGTVFFSRAASSSLALPTGPQVTINDVPMFGEAGTVLQTIDPSIVESIEFTSRLSALTMYGSQGTFGVIAVYTKSGVPVDNTDPNFQTMKLPGFSRTRKFQAPDYSNPQTEASQTDFRSTIYWNPTVEVDGKSGAAIVSFFAADLPGLYRVVVEGITAGGRPVRSEQYVTIEDRN
ncbi:MAG: carboxypeptidase regulatory-like domain-containing protein [Cytophagales bacterium]|nr:carboxypeptidase regulatory-like domain-containing protein [Cytophagales bacterium]